MQDEKGCRENSIAGSTIAGILDSTLQQFKSFTKGLKMKERNFVNSSATLYDWDKNRFLCTDKYILLASDY